MDTYHRWERRTTPWLTALALLSLVNFVLAAALGRQPFTSPVDYVAWLAFAVDYAVRLYLVENRTRFVRTHPLDLIAVGVPAIRSVRVLAVFSRVAVVAQRGRSERLLISTAVVALTVVLVGAGAVLDAERRASDANIKSYADAVWWAMTTVSTVGYGDRFPVTPEGRVVGGALMVVGIGVVGTVTAALAYRFVTSPESGDTSGPEPSLERIEARLDEITDLLQKR